MQRKSAFVAQLLQKLLAEYPNVTTELVDPNSFTFAGDGNDPEGKDANYTAVTERADGFLIVVPEYNHSFPGSLKRMLDSELETYNHKAVAFAGVSSGSWGGVRAIEALVTATRETGLVALSIDMQFPHVQELFSESGELLNEKYRERPKRMFEELLWMTRLLKEGREQA